MGASMRAQDFVTEAVDVNQALLQTAKAQRGNLDDYFVRLTDIDKLGYSARQAIGRSPDVDHPDFHIDYIGRGVGRPAQWFYPLRYYLKNKESLFAADKPYVWLVRLKPDSWLQPVDIKTKQIEMFVSGLRTATLDSKNEMSLNSVRVYKLGKRVFVETI